VNDGAFAKQAAPANPWGGAFVNPLDGADTLKAEKKKAEKKKAEKKKAEKKPFKADPGWNKGKIVFYQSSTTGKQLKATIVKVHHDDVELYYTIFLPSLGRERQTTLAKLAVDPGWNKDTTVWYTHSNGQVLRARIVKVHREDVELYYTIFLPALDRERQTTLAKLTAR
jgi:ribosomal protein L35AE/L33A